MAKWKLSRQTFGNEEYDLSEGEEVTIGRGLNNTITLSSIVISRNHCLINVKKDEVSITDLKSSNGVYIGLEKIPANIPYVLTGTDLIGFGWTIGAPLAKINDDEKFVFKLEKCFSSITSRIKFQDDVLENIEAEIASLDAKHSTPISNTRQSPVCNSKLQLKRKLIADDKPINVDEDIIIKKNTNVKNSLGDDVIELMSDSENDANAKDQDTVPKKIKLELLEDQSDHNIKFENDFQYEAFNVKQEYVSYEYGPIQISSDSDSESEHWLLRLSQSSPGKAFTKMEPKDKKPDIKSDDNSYSQLDDIAFETKEDDEDEEEYLEDLISIPLESPHDHSNEENQEETSKQPSINIEKLDKDVVDALDTTNYRNEQAVAAPFASVGKISTNTDLINISDTSYSLHETGPNCNNSSREIISDVQIQYSADIKKRTQMIEPLIQTPRRNSNQVSPSHIAERKSKCYKTRKSKKVPSKAKISNSQKEERKKKLKEIACKEKVIGSSHKDPTNNTNKSIVNVKVTTSNRGAFLTNIAQVAIKPTKRHASPLKEKERNITLPENKTEIEIDKSSTKSYENKSDKHKEKYINNTKEKTQEKLSKPKSQSNSHKSIKSINSDANISINKIKPSSKSETSYSEKPISKVEPFQDEKPKKSVRFSDTPPVIHEFEIETGNRLRKTSLVKTTLADSQRMPHYSLEKISLMKILRWNPQWLNEQMTISEPPPILGHNNSPMAIFHSFKSHKQYVGLIGDLLLMEIWECITQGYMRVRNQTNYLQLRIESLPPIPVHEQFFELLNINVNISFLTSDLKHLPRIGDLMAVEFRPENDKNLRFLYVHNVKQHPSPPHNKNSFFTLSLYATFREKMESLRPGDIIIGRNLACIKKELMLFEAMECLVGSPLSRAILTPHPYYYPRTELKETININSQWTVTLNSSQKLAVTNSVSAALGDRPTIQMVQGPPGTGKSSVICAIVMTYFYDTEGKRLENRGKILICATSNAAVDGLVIKLLNIRQKLPKAERFRMVRVGRLEAMHERARDVSSQQLAKRDAARVHAEAAPPGLQEEIAHLEAKFNMWMTAAQEAKAPERAAYCRGRANETLNKSQLLSNRCQGAGGAGGWGGGEHLLQAERRIVDRADIVVTTLASAHNNKMRGLKGCIDLCIVEEAGQAIEPETLIPLTLDVTRLTLVGDPQQLPGYICSQRAKKHGLGESLFSRLMSCAEHWAQSPVVLLDRQYRMHAAIAEYPNRAFYGGRVQSAPPRDLGLELPHYAVLGIASGDKGQNSSGANETEAWGVARVAAALARRLRGRAVSLAVITPYAAHRDALRSALRALLDPSEGAVEVNTVDSFQGQERDVVLVSLARSHGVGFLTDAGRMNVMLTRARHSLLVCLNPLAFVKNNQWQTLVDDAKRRNVYRTLPLQVCQPPPNSVPCESVLDCINNPKSSYY